MTTQFEMFPKTELDEATLVLNHLIAEEEKAEKAADSAEQKSADASMRVRKQRHVVAKLQAMMPATEPIMEAEASEDDVEDAEYLQIEGDVLDPITGEVASKEEREEFVSEVERDAAFFATGAQLVEDMPKDVEPITEEVTTEYTKACPACDGDGRPFAQDGSRNGNAKCKMCGGTGRIADNGASVIPVVVVLYPGDDDPHVTEVGPLTRYSELVADFLTYTGIDAEVDADEWQVLAERELTSETGGMRHLYDLIRSVDYGRRLIVAAADQGSVTGAPVESELVEAESR